LARKLQDTSRGSRRGATVDSQGANALEWLAIPSRASLDHREGGPLSLKRTSKYHAVPTVVDNICFASKKEARRYGELKLLEKAHQIEALCCQVPYVLAVPVNDPSAVDMRAIVGKYIADFVYYDQTGFVVEDVKGFRTPLYRWKKRHVEAQYGITIREV